MFDRRYGRYVGSHALQRATHLRPLQRMLAVRTACRGSTPPCCLLPSSSPWFRGLADLLCVTEVVLAAWTRIRRLLACAEPTPRGECARATAVSGTEQLRNLLQLYRRALCTMEVHKHTCRRSEHIVMTSTLVSKVKLRAQVSGRKFCPGGLGLAGAYSPSFCSVRSLGSPSAAAKWQSTSHRQ